jgi:hypothetical protein
MATATVSRTKSVLRLIITVVAATTPLLAVADLGPPVHIQITEIEQGLHTVQWRVPKVLPPRAVPIPVLPDSCRPVTDATVVDQPGAWLVEARWRCDTDLAGQTVGMDYPYPDLALTTVVRVDLISGDRFAQVLGQGEETWRLPEGTAAPDILAGFRRAVLAGVSHAALSWVHLLLVLALGVLGGTARTIRTVTALAIGQLVGLVAAQLAGGIGSNAGEIGFAIGVVVIARQALEPSEERRGLHGAAVLAGLVHGLGLGSMLGDEISGAGHQLILLTLAVLGMDAVHLVLGLILTAILASVAERPELARGRRLLAYGIGAVGIALSLSIALQGSSVDGESSTSSLVMPADSGQSASAGMPGSRRVAPSTPTAAIQSFLSVEPFEVRHEVSLRLLLLADELGLEPQATLGIGDQPAISQRLAEMVLADAVVTLDGRPAEGQIRRADFMTVDSTGALPRPKPVPEPVLEAVVGVVVSYPTSGMPRSADLEWRRFPDGLTAIPATVIDPETVSSSVLSDGDRRLSWQYALLEDPIPSVEAVQVEPLELPIPWLSLPLVALAGWLVVAGIRRNRLPIFSAAVRVVLAVAFLVGPIVETAVALPGSSGRTPSERQARRILAGLLPNIYRALEFRDEATIYDRLAISVTGDTLAEVYLEQRRTLELEERGGAQARVEAVEVLDATQIASSDRGFGVRAEWTVGGMVTHFGHRHFRQNRYNAMLDVTPVDGTWKIRSIEILETERLK